MSNAYKRWACGLLAVVLVLLAACAAVVYTVDPCLYYRMPDKWEPVFFSERYQGAGLAKNVPADTVLVGTSMAANYRAGEVGETFGGTAVRITIPDGYLSEFDRVMDMVFRYQSPKRVVFALDLNILVRDESGVTGAIQMLLPAVKPWMDLVRVAALYGVGMLVVLLPRNTAAAMEKLRPKGWQGAALAVLTAWAVLSFTGITTFIYSNF